MTRPPNPRDGRWPSPGGGSRVPATDRGGWPAARDDDGWGPSTAVYSSAASQAAPAPGPRPRRALNRSAPADPAAQPSEDEWRSAGPRSAREQRAVRNTEQRAVRDAEQRTERSVDALADRDEVTERGFAWWVALLVLVGIAGVGALIDNIGSINGKSGFNIGIVIASIVAIIIVKRSHMFPVVIAPPIVYSGAALIQFYVRRATVSGASKQQVLLDAAANYLVYGFPAIAVATAAVLIIAGFRLITRK